MQIFEQLFRIEKPIKKKAGISADFLLGCATGFEPAKYQNHNLAP